MAPELHVIATSQNAALGSTDVATVRTVVLAPRGNQNGSQAIQALRMIELTKGYQDLHGTTFDKSGLVAVFPLSAITGDFEIRVMFDRVAIGSTALSMCKECAVPFRVDQIR